MILPPTSVPALRLAAILASMTCAAAPAAAQEEQAVAVVGDAEQLCALGQPTQGTGTLNNFDTPSGAVFGITSLTDPLTLSTQAANITLSVGASCNGVHRVVIASDNNGLWREGATTASGLGSAVPYRAVLAWAGQQQPLTAEASARQPVEEQMLVGRPAAGEMQIEFQIEAGATNLGPGAPLLAGEYSDILRVTVESQ